MEIWLLDCPWSKSVKASHEIAVSYEVDVSVLRHDVDIVFTHRQVRHAPPLKG